MDIRKELEDLKSKIVLIEEELEEKEKEPKKFELYLKICPLKKKWMEMI